MTPTTFKIIPQFESLANLILVIMLESEEFNDIPSDFKMPQEAIDKTAKALQKGYENGNYKHTNGGLYYSGMTEDYGGYYDAVLLEVRKNDSVTVFKKKLEAFAKAAEELENAWDCIDGEPNSYNFTLSKDWPFSEQLYYIALQATRKWSRDTITNINSNL